MSTRLPPKAENMIDNFKRAGVRIPADPKKRAELMDFAGLTDEERAAIDQWCYDEQRKRDRGVLLNDAENHA